MRTLLLCLILSAIFVNPALAQKKKPADFKVAFYNTENLFDTIDDPAIDDKDFLPTSTIAWTAERYRVKLNHIARALAGIDSVNLPAVIGLAEVENIGVLSQLAATGSLKRGNYGCILEEGSDPRGIDVALLYRKDIMKNLGHKAFPSASSFKTRNILYVRLSSAKKDTFHVFVNHWKSRSGGQEKTEPQRIENARMLKHLTDSILASNPRANVVIMGDLNDEPANKSISETLAALPPSGTINPTSLYDLMYDRFKNGEGTLYYKDWDLFDQIIVSGNMLMSGKKRVALVKPPYAYIFKPDWLLYKKANGTASPNRTAGSTEYFGGYSDHLPVYMVVGN